MKEYVLNFNKQVTDVEGKPSPEINLGKLLAQHLSQLSHDQCKGVPPVKLIGWSQKIIRGDSLTLDRSDFDLLKPLATSLPHLVILVLAQIETVFQDALDAAKE